MHFHALACVINGTEMTSTGTFFDLALRLEMSVFRNILDDFLVKFKFKDCLVEAM